MVGDRLSLGAPVVGSEQSNLARPTERFVPMALFSFLKFCILPFSNALDFLPPMGLTYQITLSRRNGGGGPYN